MFSLLDSNCIPFNNKVQDGKLENSFLFRNFYNGGGVAIGDINNDGLADVMLTSNTGANKLFLNITDTIKNKLLQFKDISIPAGIIIDDQWSTGVVFADVNDDGWLDIYVCSSGHMGTGTRKNKLYINNKNLTFTEAAKNYGLDISAYTTQVSFFDYDLDGDLDCFMINNSPVPINQLNFANRRDLPDSLWKIAPFLKGGGDHLYKNEQGYFKEVTTSAGIHGGLISFGLGVSVSDINDDGWPDVFVSNDSYERDYLYINQKNGTFKDEMEQWFQHTSFSSMGADIADINNDGFQDLFTTDMLPLNDYRLKTTGSFDNISLFTDKIKSGFYYQYTKNCLQLNNKDGNFIDIARYSGVAATDWSWGALMFDMDNDGWNDLLVCNGVNRDVTNLDFMDFFANDVNQKMVMTGQKEAVENILKEIPTTPIPNQVFHNNKDLHFTEMSTQWGLDKPSFSNGAAYGDLDNDGDVDFIVNNENQPCFVYQNNARKVTNNNYIALKLKQINKNQFAIGSKVQLYCGTQILTRELVPSRGFQSSVDYTLHFGLGSITKIDSMIISWPDRTKNTIIQPVINKMHSITKSNVKPDTTKTNTINNTFFSKVESNFEKHQENEYVDFYEERLVPRIFSREGPKATTADINGDGLMDLYIGGAAGKIGQLYLQNANGTYNKKIEKAFEQFFEFEDVAVLFLDVDNDKDMDLLICPGGNNHPFNSREMQVRLFTNDGKGNFTINTSAFPNMGMNISVAINNDFNNDGYVDLFIGARSYPGIFGKDPQSYLFINDGKGHFSDIAQTVNKDIANIGMVTSAVWANIIGDDKKELVIVGEWMAPRIFNFSTNHFIEVTTNLNEMYGMWQSMSTADINSDGKEDLILGNIGENFYLQPKATNPVKLWMNDFDKNSDVDKIMTYTINGKDMPVFLKRDVQDQLPSLKKENLKHSDYAEKSIQKLFSQQLIETAIVKKFNYVSSCIAINEGNGHFKIVKLPAMSQLSCINTICPLDVNADGKIDLICGGNQFGFLPQFEKLDASFGDVLINKGNGIFDWQQTNKTGFKFRGEMRDILPLNNKNGQLILFLQNNETPFLYKLNTVSKIN